MPTLDFKGKSLVYAHHLTVPFRPLEPDAAKSLPPPKPGAIPSKSGPKSAPKSGKPSLDDNLIIHGDNLHALKALMPRYAGRVNCIYIDPPYNTGNEKWVYNDNVNSPMMKEWLKGKSPVDGEDLERHDKWLCMMWPRLQLLRELLAEDGAIFISIDDNEVHHLRMVMDEVFGEENFVGNIGWESKTKSQNTKDSFNKLQPKLEHILCYSKRTQMRFRLIQIDEKEYPEKDKDGEFRYALIEQMSALGIRSRDSMVFPIAGINPQPNKQWKIGKQMVQTFEERGDLVKMKGALYLKMRPDDERTEITDPFWAFFSKEKGTAERAKTELSNILESPSHGFETVKPASIIKQLLFHATNHESIVLDSFAGSGTTAHAVLALNKEDNGNRKFILVECEDYANKITAERTRRVIKGVKKAKDENLKTELGGSFTYCTLGKEISIENMLKGKNLPDYETLARYVAYTATGQAPDKMNPKTKRGKDGFFHETTDRMFYLIYEPKLAFLRSNESALNSDRAERITKQAKEKKKTAVVFATHKFIGQKELSAMGIVFCGLPYGLSA